MIQILSNLFSFVLALILVAVALLWFTHQRAPAVNVRAEVKPVSNTPPEDQRIVISRITVHPIKSCVGTDVTSANYTAEGLEFDRHWMVVDLKLMKQLSARDSRGIKLMRIKPLILRDESAPDGGKLKVTFIDSPETSTFSIPLCPTDDVLCDWELLEEADLWGAPVSGYVVPASEDTGYEDPSSILSDFLGHRVALIMKSSKPRFLPDDVSFPFPATVSFADFTPFLLISNASIKDAEEHIHQLAEEGSEWKTRELEIERYRPNIIVDGVEEPYGEDDWVEVEIRGKVLHFPLRCLRCMFPNVDPRTGIRDPLEPNRTMMTYRRVEAAIPGKYAIGMLGVPAEPNGLIKVGDRIRVIKSKKNPKFMQGP